MMCPTWLDATDEEVWAMQLVIGGELVDGHGTETDPVLNPASEEVLAEVPSATVEDVSAAVDAARAAGPSWGSATPAVRATALLKLADLLDDNPDALARVESANGGKPLGAAAEEMPLCSDHLRFFAGAARVLEGRAAGAYVEGYTSMVRREPVGVVGQITPWNYPLAMAIWKIAPALAAENTIVLKPSELTPLSTLLLAEISLEVLPPGVFNVVAGRGNPVGEAIVTHPAVRMVSLTGSVRTGKAIAAAASANLTRVHLELGGKAPVVVLDDADVDAVVAGLRGGAFFNPGQGERVLGFVERAADAGARIATGGGTWGERGFFVAPTVIAGPAQDAEVIQQEVFGPVVTVQRAADEAEALAWANDTVYGL